MELAFNSSCETTGSEWEETMKGIKRPNIMPTANPMHKAIAGGAAMDLETIFNIYLLKYLFWKYVSRVL
jgi:hypothetical protein